MQLKKSFLFLALGGLIASPVYAEKEEREDVGKYTVQDEAKKEINEISHSAMPVSVIDASKFHGRNISLNEVLKRVAGVRVKQQGGLGSRSTIAIQGLEGQRVKIFLDGSPLNSPDGSFGINDIPIQLIKRIEIYKGAIPGRFGADALGGAVNVVTIETPDGGYVDLNLSLGSYGEKRFSFVVKEGFKEYDIQAGFGGFYNEAANDYIMDSPHVEGLEIKRDHAAFKSVAYATGGKAKNYWFDEISWELVRYESYKETQGTRDNIQDIHDKSGINVVALGLEKTFLNQDLEMEYDFTFVDMELNHVDKATTCYNFDGSTRNCPGEGGVGELGGNPQDTKDKKVELRHSGNLLYHLNKNHALNFHINTRISDFKPKNKLSSDARNPSNITKTVLSLSHEASFFDNKIQNDFGVKNYIYDYEISPIFSFNGTKQHSGSDLGFYEAIRYEAVDDLFLKMSYEHSYRIPNDGEIFGNGSFISPAPNLVPEESHNINVGVLFDSYKFMDFPWVKLEASLFYKDLTNMIRLQPGIGANAGYINMGKTEVKGFEIEANFDINDDWYAYGNYTNQSLLDKQKISQGTNSVPNPSYNFQIPNVATQYANIGLEYKTLGLFRPDSMLKLFWETSWVDQYFYGFEMSVHQDRKIEEQLTHTAGFEYSFLEDAAILGFEVSNLTDEKVSDVFNYPLMGRTFNLNLRYLWME